MKPQDIASQISVFVFYSITSDEVQIRKLNKVRVDPIRLSLSLSSPPELEFRPPPEWQSAVAATANCSSGSGFFPTTHLHT